MANTFGSVAFYLIGTVVISSYFKDQLKNSAWRKMHYLSYVAIVPLILHSVITDPKLEDRPIDWLDAEKLFVIFCGSVIVAASLFRVKQEKNIAS